MTRRIGTTCIVLACLVSPSLEAADRVTDQQITRSLQEALKRDFRLKDAELQVSTTIVGFVTLRGTVNSYVDKHQAEMIAKRTAGVRSVANRIEVESMFRQDDEIVDDVRRRLSQSSLVRPTELRIEVNSGLVTLNGQVATWAQSRQAELVAAEVRGVMLVRNHLTIGGLASALPTRSDDQIRTDVEADHYHLVLRNRPDLVQEWSDPEVARTGAEPVPVEWRPGARIRRTHHPRSPCAAARAWQKSDRDEVTNPEQQHRCSPSTS